MQPRRVHALGYRGSSMAAVEIMKRERERERDGGIRERGGRGGK
jgi:hypothetical protein